VSAFSLDTDVLIDAAKLYPRDPFTRFWDTLEQWGSGGRIFASEEVFEEVSRVDDEVFEWAKGHKHIFRPPIEGVQNAVRRILEKFPDFAAADAGMHYADPWVIAQAIVHAAAVVAKERPAQPGARPKIPDVCQEFKVTCVSLLDLMREMKLGY
jgi:hypothetical protein